VAALVPRLATAVFALRRQAVIGLAEADSAAGVAAAAALARDADWRWRRVAAEAFGAAGDRMRLSGLLQVGDGRVVAEALQALGRVASPADSATHAAAGRQLSHDDPAVRSVAAELVGRAADGDDVAPLVAAYRRAERDPFSDARIAAVQALGVIAAGGAQARVRVGTEFGAVAPSADYLVRRAVAASLPDAAELWGPAGPVPTGRGDAEYREVARRYLVPSLRGAPPPEVVIETERGNLQIRLLPSEAPLTVAAFLDLVDRGYFDAHRWHRVVPHFVVQDGDPRGDGWGGPGFVLRDEVNPVRYQVGTMGMALSGPDTGGSQFFITHAAQPHLDGTYPVFGQLIAGGAILAAITQGDRIRSIHR
jgi:cyclophilin family peptidyl-prolyl cis-trans isomerase